MKYYSTAGQASPASFRQAVQRGLAPDGGLYMPERIPLLAQGVLERLPELSFAEIAFQAARPYLEGEIPDADLRRIVSETVDFGAPLVEVESGPAPVYSLELFHGPSLAFKDFGARFMARVLSYFSREDDQPLTILVATSGDTGSAVAMGFLEVPGIEVVILYPSGQVSHLQEQQLTTLGHNIRTLEVEGSFDDCQRLVKQAFQDRDLRTRLRLSSANSINLARLIPQTFYYFHACAQARAAQADSGTRRRLVVSVPSGNFGNLTAGLMAKRMGLPVDHTIAATNINDVVPEYLEEGAFRPRASRRTLSNAMDVGDPSNFARMMELYGHDLRAIRLDLSGRRYTDEQTLQAIADVHRRKGYLLDPHGAVGYLALSDFLRSERAENWIGIFLETAHPAKFRETCRQAIGASVQVPERLARHLHLPKRATRLAADYSALRDYLLSGS